MRKFRLVTLLLAASAFIFINCTKEGPEGPAGATGPQGPAGSTGATGATGTANVIYSPWFTAASLGTPLDSAFAVYGSASRLIRTAPGVTAPILDNGVVLSYLRFGTIISSLPNTFPAGANIAQIGIVPVVGKIFFISYTLNPVGPIAINSAAEFRYVLIPGGVLGGRGGSTEKMADIKGQLYSESQLKGMSYSEICNLLNIVQ